jgi:hypothetical protein
MAGISDNKYDVYNWIEKVIDSCTTYFHYIGAHKLVTNFYNVYGDIKLSNNLRWYLSHREILKK